MNLGLLGLCLLVLNVELSKAAVSIGANIEGISDWARSHAFVDLIKQSRAFGAPNSPWITNATTPVLDAQGWPKADFGVILWIDSMTNMTGTYKMSFQCEVNPIVTFVASLGTIKNVVFNSLTKTVTGDLVIPAGQTQTMLSFTNTKSGVRNLKIIRPGYDPLNPPLFTSAFTNHFKQFNTIRFMDWAATNGNPTSSWTQRTLTTTPSMASSKGVAWEYMIALCNQLNVNMWINVPHQADNDYVMRLATLVYSSLNSNLNVYVEYSNEVWNAAFPQYQWVLQQATNEIKADPFSILNDDKSNNPDRWVWRWTARRGVQVVNLFKNVFGASSTRVKGVFATQISYADGMLEIGLSFLQKMLGGAQQVFSYIAGAPYFSVGSADSATNLTPDNVLAALNTSVNAYKTDYSMLRYAFLSAYYGLPMIAYEGGPDTFGANNIQAKKLTTLDARMGDLCKSYLDIWYSYGFNLFTWFFGGAMNYDSPSGTWGLAQVMSNLNTPKALAIQNYISTKTGTVPTVTIGVAIPGLVDGRQSASRNYYTWHSATYQTVNLQGFVDYLVRAATTKTYNMVLTISTTSVTTIQFIINNYKQYGTFNVTNTNNVYVVQTAIAVNLNSGLNGIRFICMSGSFVIKSLNFS